ncbi:type III polyketide synthase [Yinghuangia seranimata]|uniref:type III polyketide synthase n=1 Tax=Yinghuangia seranimata TaxID=408067 RepID=UPI00248CE759|nr:3-oxoacyl-[acyl-carrier-protein] synthase III C-terminal domain-containing protein [Yinghuangia seranimata]MDI2124692.1 3-oxoacyl-[acyl-carrier-protein] synthase III C-terminal domain-containing protein [Yinghuangia seranimata]
MPHPRQKHPTRRAAPAAETAETAAAGAVIAAVDVALPPHRYPQEAITEMVGDVCLPAGADRGLLQRVHASAGVRTRHLALPIEQYAGLGDFGRANDAWIATALDLGEEAVGGALKQAGLEPGDVDLIACASVTGLAVPSLDARLAGRLGMRPDVKRLPLFGLGCVAGAAGIARLHDYLRGHPGDVAVLLCAELCSLTVQRGDDSPANLVAGALFGDGAAAVVAVGNAHPLAARAEGPRVLATRSELYPETEHVMGWEIGSSGFKVVLSADVPAFVRADLRRGVEEFLADHGLGIGDITTWVSHPGGPKVLDAVAESLGLGADALAVTWSSLASVGNMSSASVLHVLQQTREAHRPPPGSWGLLLALGPGFCSELVLLRW